jgi:hypothetical protein
MNPFKMSITQVVGDPEWQALRSSFLGTWKFQAGLNCARLREYLGDMLDPFRLRRVLNYLTGSGFRSGNIKNPAIQELLSQVREEAERWKK